MIRLLGNFYNFASVMSAKRYIEDKDFGRITLSSRRGARNITMRVKPEGLLVTVPPYTKTEKALQIVGQYREDLLERYRKVAVRPIDLDFRITAECFRLSLEHGRLKCFTVRQMESGEVKIFCPRGTDFSSKEVQKLVRGAIVRAMRKVAAGFLPLLVAVWAGRYGLSYRKVRITGARSRWGSCTAAGTISLSCYLMLVPSHLMDYVILHELAHTREMNHGPRFWELLDSMTGGHSHRLREELRSFHTSF